MIVTVKKAATDKQASEVPEGATGELTVVKPHEVSVVDRAANTHKFIFAKSATAGETRALLIDAVKSLSSLLSEEGDIAEKGQAFVTKLAEQFGMEPAVAKTEEPIEPAAADPDPSTDGTTGEADPKVAKSEPDAAPELDPFELVLADASIAKDSAPAADKDFDLIAAEVELDVLKTEVTELRSELALTKAEAEAAAEAHEAAVAKAVDTAKSEVVAEYEAKLVAKTAEVEEIKLKLSTSEGELAKAQTKKRAADRRALVGLTTGLKRIAKASAEAPQSQAQPTVERPPAPSAFREVLDINDDND